jgi:inner membrane protein
MKNENQNDIKWYESLTFKMALLGILAIMFLVPLQLIKMVINERAENSRNVQEQISEEWGKTQIIMGPVLNVPVTRIKYSGEERISTTEVIWHIMPELLEITGELSPQIRYKGIYESVIYESNLKMTGSFEIPGQKEDADMDIKWENAYYTLGITDNRGIIKDLVMISDNGMIDAQPGVYDHDISSSGVSFPSEISPGTTRLEFEINLGLRGSSGIFFTPTGKSTSVNIESSWTAPSFTGNYLPETRTMGDQGFSAHWYITHLNRNFPQSWFGSSYQPEEEHFGVNLLQEVDHYRKSERSAKYGLLFIAFTYLVFLFIELSSDRKIHLFHYFLVALSLVLFFSLLNSLSEQIGFGFAYLISSGSTIALLSVFSGILLKKPKYIIMIGGMLILLYAFIYILLSLNEFAYLAGNIGLFISLAVIMWLSAKTDLFRRTGI